MNIVKSADDLKVGDVVRVDVSDRQRTQYLRGTVARVGKTSATVLIDGQKRVIPYSVKRTERSRYLYYGASSRVYRLERFSAYDLWRERAPQSEVAWPSHVDFRVPSIIVSPEALLRDPGAVHDALSAIAAWLAQKPSE